MKEITFKEKKDENPFEGYKDNSLKRGDLFKDTGKTLQLEKLVGNGMRQIRVCQECFGTQFAVLEGGQVKCKKCGQIYWM